MNSVCDRSQGLLSLELARTQLLEGLQPIQRVLTIPAGEALGRILAEGLRTPLDFPPFANSAMDGYAVRASDAIPGATLRRVGLVMAGTASTSRLGNGECIRIFTGAPIPEGADAVVVQEQVTCDRDLIRLDLMAPLRPGDNVRQQGEELKRGKRFSPQECESGPMSWVCWRSRG